MRSVHDYAYKQICDICAKSFKSLQSYKEHYANEHSVEATHKVQCELCGKWYLIMVLEFKVFLVLPYIG